MGILKQTMKHWINVAVGMLVLLYCMPIYAQQTADEKALLDSLEIAKQKKLQENVQYPQTDSVKYADRDTLVPGNSVVIQTNAKIKRDWSKWVPDAKRAMWLAIVLPGGGQIYNRKYWKLPIFYGGFVGCIYALRWNNMMYKDYSQAYLDIMDNDPHTESYNQFLHLGTRITDANKERYTNIFKSRKDLYRRWRDLSFFCLLGVYAISVIDAYVDAQLSNFDISRDLSMRISPIVIIDRSGGDPLKSGAVGVRCSVDF